VTVGVHRPDPPRLSVIIPTYNRALPLASTLSSLSRQTLDRSLYEVRVVDDGSTDGTRDLVAGWQGLNLYYAFQEDLGYRAAAARNVGIRAAEAPVCVFVDSGMLAAPDFLERHLRSQEVHPGSVAIIGSIAGLDQHGHDHHHHNEKAIRALADEADVSGSFSRLTRSGYGDVRERLFYNRYGDQLDAWPAPWVVFWTGNASVSTSALREAGLFDEGFVTWGGEDTDLGIRLHARGARMVLDRSARAIHVPHAKALAHLSVEERGAHRRSTLERLHRKHDSAQTRALQSTGLEDLNELLASHPRRRIMHRRPQTAGRADG